MITGHIRGNTVFWTGQAWHYLDDGVAVDDDPDRPCARCGRPPTPEGHDACLGHIGGASSACCGHGVERGYVKTQNEGAN